jgi:hypothetical protein
MGSTDWSKHFEPRFASGDEIGVELLRSEYARQTGVFLNNTSSSCSVPLARMYC